MSLEREMGYCEWRTKQSLHSSRRSIARSQRWWYLALHDSSSETSLTIYGKSTSLWLVGCHVGRPKRKFPTSWWTPSCRLDKIFQERRRRKTGESCETGKICEWYHVGCRSRSKESRSHLGWRNLDLLGRTEATTYFYIWWFDRTFLASRGIEAYHSVSICLLVLPSLIRGNAAQHFWRSLLWLGFPFNMMNLFPENLHELIGVL